jgi:diguanylate cyclase (GGDEF)-like protein/PAS domain S-box-containing protein
LRGFSRQKEVSFPLIDYLKDPIVVLKRDGRILASNKAFSGVFGIDKDELADKEIRDVAPLGMLYDNFIKCITGAEEKIEQITFGGRILNATFTPVFIDGNINYIALALRDISAFVHLEKALIKKNRELGIINILSAAFISSVNLDSIFEDLLGKVLIVTDLGMGWIVMKEGDSFSLKSISGASLGLKKGLEEGKMDFLYGSVIKSRDPIYVLEKKEMENIEMLKNEGLVFCACVPLSHGTEAIGLLVLASRIELGFDFEAASLFSLIGNSLSLITEKVSLFRETERLAITDGLTGLYNIRYFYDMLEREIARGRRYNTIFSLVLFDIDDFKRINDAHGHQAGDDVLRSVASMLKAAARQPDVAARYGGEEFIFMLPNTPKHEALMVAKRTKEKVESQAYLNGEERLTISGGIATFPEDASDSKSLLYAADMTLYEAKRMGKKLIRARGED